MRTAQDLARNPRSVTTDHDCRQLVTERPGVRALRPARSPAPAAFLDSTIDVSLFAHESVPQITSPAAVRATLQPPTLRESSPPVDRRRPSACVEPSRPRDHSDAARITSASLTVGQQGALESGRSSCPRALSSNQFLVASCTHRATYQSIRRVSAARGDRRLEPHASDSLALRGK